MTLAVGLSPCVSHNSLTVVSWDKLDTYLSRQKELLCVLDGYIDVPTLTQLYLEKKDRVASKTDFFTEYLFRFSDRGNHSIRPLIRFYGENRVLLSEKEATRRIVRSMLIKAAFGLTKFLATERD